MISPKKGVQLDELSIFTWMASMEGIIVERQEEPVALTVEKVLGGVLLQVADEVVDEFFCPDHDDADFCVFVSPKALYISLGYSQNLSEDMAEGYSAMSPSRIMSYMFSNTSMTVMWSEFENGRKKSTCEYQQGEGPELISGPDLLGIESGANFSEESEVYEQGAQVLMEQLNGCPAEEFLEMRVLCFKSLYSLPLNQDEEINEASLDRLKASFIDRFDKRKDAFMNPALTDINSALSRQGVFVPRLDWLFKNHEEWDKERLEKEIAQLDSRVTGFDPLDAVLKKNILIRFLRTKMLKETKDVEPAAKDEKRIAPPLWESPQEVAEPSDEEKRWGPQSDQFQSIPEPRVQPQAEQAPSEPMPVSETQSKPTASARTQSPPPPRSAPPRQYKKQYGSSSGIGSGLFIVLKLIAFIFGIAGLLRTCSSSSYSDNQRPVYTMERTGIKRSLTAMDVQILERLHTPVEQLRLLKKADARWSFDGINQVFFKSGSDSRLQFLTDTVKYFTSGKDLRVMEMSDKRLTNVDLRVKHSKYPGFHFFLYDATEYQGEDLKNTDLLGGEHFDMISSLSVSKAKRFMSQRNNDWTYDKETKIFTHKTRGYKLRIGARKMIYDTKGEGLALILKDLNLKENGSDTLRHEFNASTLLIVKQD